MRSLAWALGLRWAVLVAVGLATALWVVLPVMGTEQFTVDVLWDRLLVGYAVTLPVLYAVSWSLLGWGVRAYLRESDLSDSYRGWLWDAVRQTWVAWGRVKGVVWFVQPEPAGPVLWGPSMTIAMWRAARWSKQRHRDGAKDDRQQSDSGDESVTPVSRDAD